MEMQCVYFKLGTELLHIIQMNFVCHFGGMTQAVRWQPLTTEAEVGFQASAHGICGGQTGSGTGFLLTSFYQCSIFKATLNR